jgi:hypothetical protein
MPNKPAEGTPETPATPPAAPTIPTFEPIAVSTLPEAKRSADADTIALGKAIFAVIESGENAAQDPATYTAAEASKRASVLKRAVIAANTIPEGKSVSVRTTGEGDARRVAVLLVVTKPRKPRKPKVAAETPAAPAAETPRRYSRRRLSAARDTGTASRDHGAGIVGHDSGAVSGFRAAYGRGRFATRSIYKLRFRVRFPTRPAKH